jgi:predicted GNAT family acetyltransferase
MADAVRDNAARSRYELEVSGQTAFLDYRQSGKLRVLTHAEVPQALRGAGIAARLTAGALELVRAEGGKVLPRCPYVVEFIERNPQFNDLLAAP